MARFAWRRGYKHTVFEERNNTALSTTARILLKVRRTLRDNECQQSCRTEPSPFSSATRRQVPFRRNGSGESGTPVQPGFPFCARTSGVRRLKRVLRRDTIASRGEVNERRRDIERTRKAQCRRPDDLRPGLARLPTGTRRRDVSLHLRQERETHRSRWPPAEQAVLNRGPILLCAGPAIR